MDILLIIQNSKEFAPSSYLPLFSQHAKETLSQVLYLDERLQ
jgi:hypothetical protein